MRWKIWTLSHSLGLRLPGILPAIREPLLCRERPVARREHWRCRRGHGQAQAGHRGRNKLKALPSYEARGPKQLITLTVQSLLFGKQVSSAL